MADATGSCPPEVVLFDLGGVLVELTGVPRMLEWSGGRYTVEGLWQAWIASPAIRAFETGRIGSAEFADRVVAEFALPVSREQFLAEFTVWPSRPFPGVPDLLQAVHRRHTVACLSNTNAVHWGRICTEMALEPYFDHAFASHLTGLVKPDDAAFEHALAVLDVEPRHVLFLDDGRANIEAAARLGLCAVRVHGPDQTRQALIDHGALPAGWSPSGQAPEALPPDLRRRIIDPPDLPSRRRGSASRADRT